MLMCVLAGKRGQQRTLADIRCRNVKPAAPLFPRLSDICNRVFTAVRAVPLFFPASGLSDSIKYKQHVKKN